MQFRKPPKSYASAFAQSNHHRIPGEPAGRTRDRPVQSGRRPRESGSGMIRPAAQPYAIPAGGADAVLNALPHPVILVAADGRITDANVAAEAFFEASVMLLRRQVLRDLVPFG